MTQRAFKAKRTKRTEEEAQLLAEEKWLEETLVAIRKQRHFLLMERKELESLKARLNNYSPNARARKASKASQTAPSGGQKDSASPGPSQPQQGPTIKQEQKSVMGMTAQASSRHDDDKNAEDDIKRDTEELNVDPNPDAPAPDMSAPPPKVANDSSDDESEDYESDPDELIVDMNMLMNATGPE